MAKKVWETEIAGFKIALEKRVAQSFGVWYGAQHDVGLTYEQACAKIGQAVMHALTCEGKLD